MKIVASIVLSIANSVAQVLPRNAACIAKKVVKFGTVCLLLTYSSLAATGSDVLRVGIVSLPPAYGNPFAAMGAPGVLTWQQLFDGLTRIDETGNVVDALATDWQLVDAHTWRFQLRDNVRFSNGAPFDAEKAKEVFDWLLNDVGRLTPVGNELRGLAEISTVGLHELVVKTHRPDPILPNRLTMVMMVDPKAWTELGPKAFAQKPVGTGPYMVKSWRNRNGAAELVENRYAWRRPHIKTVELFPLHDHAARFQAAISNQLHLTQSMRPEEIRIFQERGFDVLVDPSKQIIGIAFDVVGHPESPVADRRVRQAINYAVDTYTISEIITYGKHSPASQGAAPGVFGYNPDVKPYPYDPAKARALLVDAGYPDGFTINATIVMGTYANDVEIYQKVQQDLAKVGISMVLEATLFSDWIRQYVTGKWRTEAFSLAWNTAPYNDSIRPMDYFSCGKALPFYCNRSMMPAIEHAATEMRSAEREQALRDLQLRFHDEAPSLFLLEYGHIWVSSSEITGFALANAAPQLYKLKLESRD
jgi:peptide/nickel transport system substrate-binding protein